MWISQEKARGGRGNRYRVRRETEGVSQLVPRGPHGQPVH